MCSRWFPAGVHSSLSFRTERGRVPSETDWGGREDVAHRRLSAHGPAVLRTAAAVVPKGRHPGVLAASLPMIGLLSVFVRSGRAPDLWPGAQARGSTRRSARQSNPGGRRRPAQGREPRGRRRVLSAAPARISDSEEFSVATTGMPQAIASSGGNPKPSHREGYTKTAARW
jgi:hypothetical protein